MDVGGRRNVSSPCPLPLEGTWVHVRRAAPKLQVPGTRHVARGRCCLMWLPRAGRRKGQIAQEVFQVWGLRVAASLAAGPVLMCASSSFLGRGGGAQFLGRRSWGLEPLYLPEGDKETLAEGVGKPW